jgi:hypothetical protein
MSFPREIRVSLVLAFDCLSAGFRADEDAAVSLLPRVADGLVVAADIEGAPWLAALVAAASVEAALVEAVLVEAAVLEAGCCEAAVVQSAKELSNLWSAGRKAATGAVSSVCSVLGRL